MPGASTARTCLGSLRPAMDASSAGMRLSRISVVLPEPDTPVTTLSRPLWKFHLQRPHGVDGPGGEPQPPEAEQFLPARPLPQPLRVRPAQKRPMREAGVRSQLRQPFPAR